MSTSSSKPTEADRVGPAVSCALAAAGFLLLAAVTDSLLLRLIVVVAALAAAIAAYRLLSPAGGEHP